MNANILAAGVAGSSFDLRTGSVEQHYRQNETSADNAKGLSVSGDTTAFSEEALSLAYRMAKSGEMADGETGGDLLGGDNAGAAGMRAAMPSFDGSGAAQGAGGTAVKQPSETVSVEDQIKELQEEIQELEEEIQELQTKAANGDESAKALLKGKQVELQAKQAQLTELMEQQEKQS